jgi:hypothetical protein
MSEARKTNRPKGGRPKKLLSDEDFREAVSMVEEMATAKEVADAFGMCEDTLNARLRERGCSGFSGFYQKKHVAQGKIRLRRAQFRAAAAGNASLLIFLGKNYLGQADKSDLTSGGKPIEGLRVMFQAPPPGKEVHDP